MAAKSPAAKARQREYQRLWYWRNRTRLLKERKTWNRQHGRAAQRKCLYGVKVDELRKLEKKQRGRCAICRRPTKKTLHVDHDHKTGRFRGLLCGPCNGGLGFFRDDCKVLKRAIRYLQTTKAL